MKHGEFIPWLDAELKSSTFKVRTAQRYMKIAKGFSRVEDLVAWKPSLSQTYISCAMLPEPAATEKPAVIDKEAAARAGVVKSVTSVQNKPRSISSGRNFSLDDETRKELVSAKAEIDQLFKTLIG